MPFCFDFRYQKDNNNWYGEMVQQAEGIWQGAESTRVRERAFGEIYLVQGNFWKTIASCDDFLKNYCVWRSF